MSEMTEELPQQPSTFNLQPSTAIDEPLIFERSASGRLGASLPALDVPAVELPAKLRRRQAPGLPEVSELDVVRHFTRLAHRNFSIDTTFYPLGSCTMKYNPKICDKLAGLPGFARLHPDTPDELAQGTLQLLYELERWLCEMTGMDAFTLQPAAGAHGELAGMLVTRAYHAARRESRSVVVIPDSAHGTNPASAAMVGYRVVTIPSDAEGCIDLKALRDAMTRDVAVFMLTNPNTLGLFERQMLEIAKIVHDHGALLYLDGANLNAMLGLMKPGDMGFDLAHLNLHKSFATPHGGGGPGAGPLGVKQSLVPYLPTPRVVRDGEAYRLSRMDGQSIGRIRSFVGNVGVLIRAYAYMRALGGEGLRHAAEQAIINANYLRVRLRERYPVAFNSTCMHECVLTAAPQKRRGVRAADIAKRLLDYGFYAPTIYFPLIVDEALMIEPTETESKETLDQFVEAMRRIDEESQREPRLLREAPHVTPVRRLDEVTAARQPNLRWKPSHG